MTAQNPKLAGSGIADCAPHGGLCPIGCAECYYNRPGAWYGGHDAAGNPLPVVPEPPEVLGKVVRMCSGHDASIRRKMVIEAVYFCTSEPTAIAKLPGPVDHMANRREERPETWTRPRHGEIPVNIMSIRLRVTPARIGDIAEAAAEWAAESVPVLLTPMSYWSMKPPTEHTDWYEWKVRHINSYWCATAAFKKAVLDICPTFGIWWCEGSCKDCNACEAAYWLAKRRLADRGMEQ